MKPPYADRLDTFLNGTEMNARYERDDLQKLAAELYAMGLRDGKVEMRERADNVAVEYGPLDNYQRRNLRKAIRALTLEDSK